MREIPVGKELVAYCGLYCGACGAYLRSRCPGCRENTKATWCKVRSCCIENNYMSCADCKDYQNPENCRLFNSFAAKIFSLIFRSDRAGCIEQIRALGLEAYAEKMAKAGRMSVRREKRLRFPSQP